MVLIFGIRIKLEFVNNIRNHMAYWECDMGFHICEKDSSDA